MVQQRIYSHTFSNYICSSARISYQGYYTRRDGINFFITKKKKDLAEACIILLAQFLDHMSVHNALAYILRCQLSHNQSLPLNPDEESFDIINAYRFQGNF